MLIAFPPAAGRQLFHLAVSHRIMLPVASRCSVRYVKRVVFHDSHHQTGLIRRDCVYERGNFQLQFFFQAPVFMLLIFSAISRVNYLLRFFFRACLMASFPHGWVRLIEKKANFIYAELKY